MYYDAWKTCSDSSDLNAWLYDVEYPSGKGIDELVYYSLLVATHNWCHHIASVLDIEV